MTRRGAHTRRADGMLPVTCWCEATIVHVSEDDVAAGITASCGRRDCTPPPRVGRSVA